jgi:hypothetical protein
MIAYIRRLEPEFCSRTLASFSGDVMISGLHNQERHSVPAVARVVLARANHKRFGSPPVTSEVGLAVVAVHLVVHDGMLYSPPPFIVLDLRSRSPGRDTPPHVQPLEILLGDDAHAPVDRIL